MNNRATILGWLILCAASAATGYYCGVGRGAETLGILAEINSTTDALGQVRMSTEALRQNDFAYLRKHHESFLETALSRLGMPRQYPEYWDCSDRDKATIASANEYIRERGKSEGTSFLSSSEPELQALLIRGLQFCQEP
jgi:hypothetical protein